MPRSIRNLAIALALLATVFNASVLAWHAAARLNVSSAEAQLIADLKTAICHGGRQVDDQPASPVAPAPKTSDCLICQGLAAMGPVVLAQVVLVGPVEVTLRTVFPPSDSRAINHVMTAPRNRGPPQPV